MLCALLGFGRLFVMHVRRRFWFVMCAREEGLYYAQGAGRYQVKGTDGSGDKRKTSKVVQEGL